MHPLSTSSERSGRSARIEENAHREQGELWQRMLSPANLLAALNRVEANWGAPGSDGMTMEQLRPWLREHWVQVREDLDAGVFRPQPVRRVTIPKPWGGQRMLGVPRVLDRFLQQAIAQVLTPVFDPEFCPTSFGFRPGRSAHQAVRAAVRAIGDGHRWVVDLDLDRFFDRVQHDALMARVARKVDDRRVLKLIRRVSGSRDYGRRDRVGQCGGDPAGSPLSPILSNIMLDDLDRELWFRRSRFVRYADDVRIFVRSKRAASRVLASVTKVIEGRLRLKVNRVKLKVVPASVMTMPGFGFYFARGGQVRIRVDPKAIDRLKFRVKELTSRRWSIAMDERIAAINRYVTGWMGYFRLADTPKVFAELDKWFRRRMRQIRWKEWKRWSARYRNLKALGIGDRQAREWASGSKGYWRVAGSAVLDRALPNSYWDDQGLKLLKPTWQRLRSA